MMDGQIQIGKNNLMMLLIYYFLNIRVKILDIFILYLK